MDTFSLETMLVKDERDNRIEKVFHVEKESAVPKGQNYGSVITRVKFDVVLGSGRRKKRNIIVKQQLSGKAKDVLKELPVFRIETKVYRDILSQMEILMEEFNDRRGLLWGRLLGYHPYDKLVFEDLTAEDYKVADRTKCLDLNHGILTLTSMGRFHAMSKILLERDIISQDDIKPFFVTDNSSLLKNLFKGGLNKLSEIMLSSWGAEWEDLAHRFKNETDVVGDKLQAIGKYKNENYFEVLNHGDPWICNIMYKYSSYSNQPVSLRFVDFQISHISSYIWDVAYFLYTSMIPEVRRKNLTTLVTSYWDSLRYTLRFYGYEDKIPTLDDVKKELERVDYFAFLMLAIFHPFMTHDAPDNFDIGKINDKDGADQVINSEALNSKYFMKNVSEDFKIFAEKGVI